MHTTRTLLALVAVAIACSGCVGFSGPNDVRNQLAAQENVRLDQQMGVTVGPLGIFLANTLAAPWLPVSLDGLSWVSYGEYDVCRLDPSSERFTLRELELNGWERIVRVCESREEIIVMVNDDEEHLRKVLFVQNEGDVVRLAKVEGDLEKVIDRVFESDLIDWDFPIDGVDESVAASRVDGADDGSSCRLELLTSSGWCDGDVVAIDGSTFIDVTEFIDETVIVDDTVIIDE